MGASPSSMKTHTKALLWPHSLLDDFPVTLGRPQAFWRFFSRLEISMKLDPICHYLELIWKLLTEQNTLGRLKLASMVFCCYYGATRFSFSQKIELGLFEKSQKGQNQYQNVILVILDLGSVKVVKNAWTIEVILLNRKIANI